jgi:transcriptional regulator with XRE-family HTH domain
MDSKLSQHFRQARLSKGLTLGQLTRLVGYKKVSKGANRINAFEHGGSIHADLRGKLAEVLGIDHLTVERLMEEDRRQFFAE